MLFWNMLDMTSEEEKRENRRSRVRIIVTYFAAGFLFIVGPLFIGYFAIIKEDIPAAKDLFLTILPISAAVVTYWFAKRK